MTKLIHFLSTKRPNGHVTNNLKTIMHHSYINQITLFSSFMNNDVHIGSLSIKPGHIQKTDTSLFTTNHGKK